MHLDQNCTKIMLMVIVICTGIERKFYSTYLFGVTPDICIDIHRDVKNCDMIRGGVRGTDYFNTEDLNDFFGVAYGWFGHRHGGGQSSKSCGVQAIKDNARVEA